MEQSIELRDLVLQYYKALSSADISFIENLFSQRPGVLVIGSDPNEWWADYKTIISGQKPDLEGMSKFIDVDTKAYNEGTVGWAASQVIMKSSDNQEIPFRVSYIFHQENGRWKIVQAHASVGVLNGELIDIVNHTRACMAQMQEE